MAGTGQVAPRGATWPNGRVDSNLPFAVRQRERLDLAEKLSQSGAPAQASYFEGDALSRAATAACAEEVVEVEADSHPQPPPPAPSQQRLHLVFDDSGSAHSSQLRQAPVLAPEEGSTLSRLRGRHWL
jgi:hypothetical protein